MAEVGNTISDTGSIIEIGLDLVNGECIKKDVAKFAVEKSIGRISNKAMDKAAKINGTTDNIEKELSNRELT